MKLTVNSDLQVATSCAEAGVESSFRSAFRDRSAWRTWAGSWAVVDLLQIAGRASRFGIADCRVEITEWAGGNGARRGSTSGSNEVAIPGVLS